MEQLSSLIEFRQAVYDNGLTLAKEAQFKLVDALLGRYASSGHLTECPLVGIGQVYETT